MKFEEVLPALREGKKVSNKKWYGEWDSKDIIIVLSEGDVTALLFDEEWEVVEDYEDVEVWDWVVYGNGPHAEVHRGKTNAEMQWVIWRNILPCKMSKLEGTQRIERRKK
jgi:hypothetical protein